MSEGGQAASILGSRLRRGSKNVGCGQKALSTTAIMIVQSRVDRAAVLLVNLGAIDIYIGIDNTVTSSTGTLLLGTKGTAITLPTQTEVWAIAASGTPSISYMDFYG